MENLRDTRPIYTSLPELYSEFTFYDRLTDSAYLVEFWENVFRFWNSNLDNLLNFDGSYQNFTDNQLLALAPFFGFSGYWFNDNWNRDQLIALFYGVYHKPFIWNNRGSLTVLNYVMDVLMIPGNLSKQSGFIAGRSKAGDVCGSPDDGEYTMYIPENMSPDNYDDLLWIVKRFIPLHIHVELVPTQDPNLVQRPNIPFIA
jgi:hypothetical protein